MNHSQLILEAIARLLEVGDHHITVYKLEKITGLNRGSIHRFFKKIQITQGN